MALLAMLQRNWNYSEESVMLENNVLTLETPFSGVVTANEL